MNPCYTIKSAEQIWSNINNSNMKNHREVSDVHTCTLQVLIKQGISLCFFHGNHLKRQFNNSNQRN